jgi:hypothetical protein
MRLRYVDLGGLWWLEFMLKVTLNRNFFLQATTDGVIDVGGPRPFLDYANLTVGL